METSSPEPEQTSIPLQSEWAAREMQILRALDDARALWVEQDWTGARTALGRALEATQLLLDRTPA
jgi:hypothetical protein